MTRGQRNSNPLNIRRVAGTVWRGQAAEQDDPEFVRFRTPAWGIRAAFCILETYREKYKVVCIDDIIRRWAPPSENDTDAYIKAVCKATGYGGKERLTKDMWPRLIAAMALIESRWELPSEQIALGYELYMKLKNR